MKEKTSEFIVRVGCQRLGKVELFTVKSSDGDRAWRAALDQFFEKYPQALERGMTVGGSVRPHAV